MIARDTMAVLAATVQMFAAPSTGSDAADNQTRQIFKGLDKNEGGDIEPKEFRKDREMFERIDVDGNGRLDLEEFANRKKTGAASAPMKKVAQRDKCRDGTFAKAGARARQGCTVLIVDSRTRFLCVQNSYERFIRVVTFVA